MKKTFALLTAGMFFINAAIAQTIPPCVFSFDNGPYGSSLPINLVPDTIPIGVNYPTAHFTATGQGYSIQSANVLGFTPSGFSGLCLYPNSVFASDLSISFDKPLISISMLYAPEEYGCDNSCVMKISAYSGATLVGTNFAQIKTPGTWPTGTLSFNNGSPFDNVVVHYQTPPSGENWGPIFMVDNITVQVAVPLPTNFAIVQVPNNLIMVTWPSSWGSYPIQLQSNTNLLNTNGWINVTNEPLLTFPVYNVVLELAAEKMFFRLLLVQ